MIRRLMLAAAMLVALPAAAQTGPADAYDNGDWWLIAPPGDAIILSNGTGKRTGDIVELDLFAIYREPHEEGMIGLRLRSPVDCKARTGDMWHVTIFFADREPLEQAGTPDGMKPLEAQSLAYDFACKADHPGAKHFTNRSRRAVADEIFGR